MLLFNCIQHSQRLSVVSAEQRTTPQGQVYYFHAHSGVSTWHDPRVPRSVSALSCYQCWY